MRDVAAEIGISDLGLRKVCVKSGVDTPPQGHWRKVVTGAPIATPALTTGRHEQVIDIVMPDPPHAACFGLAARPREDVSVGNHRPCPL